MSQAPLLPATRDAAEIPTAPVSANPAQIAEPPLHLRLAQEVKEVVKAPDAAKSGADRAIPLEVIVNGSKSGTWLLLEHAGELYAPRDAFEVWRVTLSPGAAAINFRGEQYFPLSAVPGYRVRLDSANQSVELLFSPNAFAATRLTQPLSKRSVVSPVLPSVFFNYDMNYSASSLRDAPSIQDLGLITETGISTGWGVLTSNSVGRNLTGDSTLGQKRSFTRLETTFTKDFPDKNHTLRLGDTTSLGGTQGRDFYFGGIQYGTNFALTPGFISQPLPIFRGLSEAPSTVELFVNDVLRQSSNVPTGPFTVGNFPIMTGGGQAQLVVRDVLGRETVTTIPFFTSARLLAAGLDEWRVEAGSVRRNLGTDSSNYDTGFVSGTWRHGYDNALTLEGRADAGTQLQTLWLSAVSALPGQFLGRVGWAGSQDDRLGNGGAWLLGLERVGLRSGVQVQVKEASRDFRNLALEETVLPTRQEIAGNWTYTTGNAGTFGVGFASIDRYDFGSVTTASLNHTIRIGARASLMLNATRAVVADNANANTNANFIGVTLILPMGGNRIASANAEFRDGQNDLYATVSESPVDDAGLGWRLLAGQQQGRERAEGGVTYLGRYGQVSGEISSGRDQTAVRLGASGGLALADGHLFVTRRLDESFAVAEVKGYGGVGIGLGGQVLTRTDADGIALIPRLMAYQDNSVRVDPNELPMSAELDSIEQIAVPPWRSAVKVVFPVRSGRGALLRIVFDDGDVAPAGAIARIKGDSQEFYVARRGEAFVTGLQTTNRVMLDWKRQQCEFEVTLPAETPDEVPRLGPLLCTGVTR
jgi:outer membrane usher protein